MYTCSTKRHEPGDHNGGDNHNDGGRSGHNDEGQVMPLGIVLLTLLALGIIAIAVLGARAADLARAQTAADAAALAAAGFDEDAGATLAAANGANTANVALSEVGAQPFASANITHGEISASAVARGLQTQGTSGLAPSMVAALARAEILLGEPVPVVSGWRSPEEQQALWNNRASNPYPVAAPGTSLHEQGLAIDVPIEMVERLLAIAPQIGLCQPLPVTDPIHFTWCGLPAR